MKMILSYTKLMAVAMMAMMAFTSCSNDDEDGYIASTLRNHDWQGYIGAYYDRWGISGSEYATVFHFSSKDAYYTSGRGEELDYNTRSPYDNFAYCTFKWFIVDGDITLIYDDDKWSPIYIVDYSLSSSLFRGYIYDGSKRKIKFSLESTDFTEWDRYNEGGFGEFSHQSYYHSRLAGITTSDAAASDVPFVNRTEQARLHSGNPNAVSIASGIFAEKLKE